MTTSDGSKEARKVAGLAKEVGTKGAEGGGGGGGKIGRAHV